MKTGNGRKILRRGLGGGLAALAGVYALSPALGQVTPLMVMEHKGASSWVVSEKDEALGRALAMLPARLSDLPAEVEDMPREAREVIGLALQIMARPSRWAIVHDEEGEAALMGYSIVVSLDAGDEDEARDTHDTLLDLLEEAQERGLEIEPCERFEGLSEIPTPAGPIAFGPRRSGGRWHYDIIVGATGAPDTAWASIPRADDLDAVLTARIDLSALNPLADFGRAMSAGAPQADAMFEAFERSGIIGEETIKIDYAYGYSETHAVERYEIIGAGDFADGLGLATEPLTEDEMRVIPADAVMATISRVNWDSLTDALDFYREMGVPVDEGLEEIERMTGIDLMDDVVGSLGSTVALYTSDATGGGGLLSGVMLLGIDDARTLGEAHGRLLDLIREGMSHDEFASRYVAINAWEDHGHTLFSLQFNGLPIPLEITWSLTDDWLVMGATPQSVLAAIAQSEGHGDAGLGRSRALRNELPPARSFTSVTWLDAQRLAQKGYPIASMLGSAVANGVRGHGREPGVVTPPYHRLMDGARPIVGVSFWDGDDYVVEWRADRSLLVQTAVGGGAVMEFAPLVAAIMFPAMANARHDDWSMLAPLFEQPALAVRAIELGASPRAILSAALIEARGQ